MVKTWVDVVVEGFTDIIHVNLFGVLQRLPLSPPIGQKILFIPYLVQNSELLLEFLVALLYFILVPSIFPGLFNCQGNFNARLLSRFLYRAPFLLYLEVSSRFNAGFHAMSRRVSHRCLFDHIAKFKDAPFGFFQLSFSLELFLARLCFS